MSLQDSLFAEQVEYDVTLFAKNTTHKRWVTVTKDYYFKYNK